VHFVKVREYTLIADLAVLPVREKVMLLSVVIKKNVPIVMAQAIR
jgi:hypothetical protein